MSRISRNTVIALAAFLSWPLSTYPSASSNDEVERVQNSIAVLHDLTATPDKAIPQHLLDRAEAIVVVPTLVKGGFVVGAKHGRGVMSVRRQDNSRAWSDPAFVTMTGGSIGWQVGVETVDLVLLVMNRKGVDDLLADKFTLGGEASVAAGPVGRTANAETDAKLSSQILAYSRTNGLFAGATLEGASLKSDHDSNKAFYGEPIDAKTITTASHEPAKAPAMARTWRETLRNLAPPDKQ